MSWGVCWLRRPCSPEMPFLRSSPFSFVRRRRLFGTTCSVSGTKKKNKEKVIVISGPTGAGKSRLAMELAKRLNGEIISADSVQVYRGLDVGSAKPSLMDRKEVPHHLVDILHPSEDYSVGQFFEDAREKTRDILNSGRVPIVAGGTGLYLRWFIYGKPDVPKASQEITSEVYSELMDLQRNGDWDAAVQLVVKAGDSKAQSLAANDWYRLRRSLEIIKSSGSPPSAFHVPYDSFREQSSTLDHSHDVNSSSDGSKENKSKELDFEFICFFLSSQRLDLYRLIDLRCEDMLLVMGFCLRPDGFLIMVFFQIQILQLEQLVTDRYSLIGYDGKLLGPVRFMKSFRGRRRLKNERDKCHLYFLAPKEIKLSKIMGSIVFFKLLFHYDSFGAMEYLVTCREQGGRSSPQEFFAFLSEFQKASRNFAKRQMTWFRNELIYHWLDASRPLEMVLDLIHEAYHEQTGKLVVPKSLSMKKDISSNREINELKAYRTKNRHFINREDCSDILDWIWRTQQ